MAITTNDLPLLHSLTSEWTTFADDADLSDPCGISITVRKLRDAGLAEFDGTRARRTAKGTKYMRKGRVSDAEHAFKCFKDGIRDAHAGEHVPSWQELYDGYSIIDPKRSRCDDQSLAGDVDVIAGRIFAREHNIATDHEPTIADYYRAAGLSNARTIFERLGLTW
jgi:hypothetical protein